MMLPRVDADVNPLAFFWSKYSKSTIAHFAAATVRRPYSPGYPIDGLGTIGGSTRCFDLHHGGGVGEGKVHYTLLISFDSDLFS
jgi:hypothetical protein